MKSNKIKEEMSNIKQSFAFITLFHLTDFISSHFIYNLNIKNPLYYNKMFIRNIAKAYTVYFKH